MDGERLTKRTISYVFKDDIRLRPARAQTASKLGRVQPAGSEAPSTPTGAEQTLSAKPICEPGEAPSTKL